MTINKIKELEEIKIELRSLEVKIIMERIKNEVEEIEIKMLETGTENKMEAFKETEKTVRKKIEILTSKLEMTRYKK